MPTTPTSKATGQPPQRQVDWREIVIPRHVWEAIWDQAKGFADGSRLCEEYRRKKGESGES